MGLNGMMNMLAMAKKHLSAINKAKIRHRTEPHFNAHTHITKDIQPLTRTPRRHPQKQACRNPPAASSAGTVRRCCDRSSGNQRKSEKENDTDGIYS